MFKQYLKKKSLDFLSKLILVLDLKNLKQIKFSNCLVPTIRWIIIKK